MNDGSTARSGIGTLKEHSLHAQIIQHLSRTGDQLEADLNGYVIDILRGGQIIEVQTRNLGKLLPKLRKLSDEYQVEIVFPIPQIKYIRKISGAGEFVSRRKSPKRGRPEDVFRELVRATGLINHPNTSLTLLMIEAEEVWRDDGEGSWRRKHWSIYERHMLQVHGRHTYKAPADFLSFLPKSLPSPFTNRQLAKSLKIQNSLAGKITYTLKKMNLLEIIGKEGRANLFQTL